MKIPPLGAELFDEDRQTDRKKLLVTFRNFANAPKKKAKVSLLLECGAASLVIGTFRGNVVVSSSRVEMSRKNDI
jgi:hypothetical protein